MKLGIKQNTVAQCFNLFLQASFLTPKVLLCLKNSASTAATLWVAAAQARFQETRGGTSSVVAAVLGDATFGRVCKAGVHLFGRRYEAEAFEEARPDAFYSRCCRWGHIAPHCSESPRCALCAEGHTTHDHQCSVEGCKAGRGHGCTHVTTQCANCKGPPPWGAGRPLRR